MTTKAVIPKSLETVDIGLRKDEVGAAVEISSTTRADQEIQNIRKCLDAGYDYVVAVSSDEKSLSSLKTGVKSAFTMRERERIRFYEPNFKAETAIEYGRGGRMLGDQKDHAL